VRATGPVQFHVAMAATSRLVPTIFMTRVRLYKPEPREPFPRLLSEGFWSGSVSPPCGPSTCRTDARLSRLAHSKRVRVKALLHGIEQMLMLPSWNPPLWPCRALGLQRAVCTGCGPVAPHPLVARQSITSSERSKSAGGIVKPIALAVLRFTTSSNLEGCSIGNSAGLAPRRTLSTRLTTWR
jgi:hypothetical protein